MSISDVIKNTIEETKNKGFKNGLIYVKDIMLVNLYNKSNFSRPSLNELFINSYFQSTDVTVILKKMGIRGSNYDREFNEIYNKYIYLSNKLPLRYGKIVQITKDEAKVYYILVREFKPNLVFETGIADGTSTFFILSALEKNGGGKLVSTDIQDDVGILVPTNLKKFWEKKILHPIITKNFTYLIDGFKGKIDLFIHDSDHSYKWQSLEYNLALKNLSKNGILVSDDIDSSYAFIDLKCRKFKKIVLVTERKAMGILMRRVKDTKKSL